MTVGADRLEILRFVIGVVMIYVVNIKLTRVNCDEAASFAMIFFERLVTAWSVDFFALMNFACA